MEAMDAAAGFAAYLVDQLERAGVLRLLPVALLLAALVATIALAGLVPPAPEPIVAAPFRW
jgi:hypothetical protein